MGLAPRAASYLAYRSLSMPRRERGLREHCRRSLWGSPATLLLRTAAEHSHMSDTRLQGALAVRVARHAADATAGHDEASGLMCKATRLRVTSHAAAAHCCRALWFLGT